MFAEFAAVICEPRMSDTLGEQRSRLPRFEKFESAAGGVGRPVVLSAPGVGLGEICVGFRFRATISRRSMANKVLPLLPGWPCRVNALAPGLARVAAVKMACALPRSARQPKLFKPTRRRGGRVAEGGGLLNRYTV